MGLEHFAGRPCPAWYDKAGFGIFIHWGIFAIPAFAPRGRAIHELMRDAYDDMNKYLPYAEWYENAARLEGSPTQLHHQRPQIIMCSLRLSALPVCMYLQ